MRKGDDGGEKKNRGKKNKLGLSCAKLRTASLLRLLLLVNSNFGNVKNEVLHVR